MGHSAEPRGLGGGVPRRGHARHPAVEQKGPRLHDDRRTAPMIIAVDGPAASGKGTLAAGLARHYQLPHLDTGLLYRAVGMAIAGHENDADFSNRAIETARGLDTTALDPETLGTAEAGTLASKVAVIGEVRQALFDAQRKFA